MYWSTTNHDVRPFWNVGFWIKFGQSEDEVPEIAKMESIIPFQEGSKNHDTTTSLQEASSVRELAI